MLLLRTVLTAALPLLVLSSSLEQCALQLSAHYNSPVLASLQCYNDFTTQIRCTWEEEPHTHLHMPISKGLPCVPDDHSELQYSGKVTRSCVYKTKVFSMGRRVFYFNTTCPSKVTKLNIAAQGKVLPPNNFSQEKVNGHDRLLRWSSPYPPSSPRTLNLTYQLKYRRHENDWIVVDNISMTQYVIESKELLLGYLYEARVRAQGPVGLWSNWSPRVVWIMEEEGIINLQCVINEEGVTCSWQVKKRQAEFLSYHLCGHINGTREKCNHCHSHAEHPHLETLRHFTCSLDSSEPELLTMEIRSFRKVKYISDPDNIQSPPPSQIRAHKKDGVWKLSWTRPTVEEQLMLTYQVYIESNDTKHKVQFNLSEASLSSNVPSTLWPSTAYMARVRAIPSRDFNGRPSEWSDPTYFTTDPAPWYSTIMYCLIAALVAVFFIILYNALPACHRRLMLWNVSIPSPNYSKVLGEISSKNFPASEANQYTDNEKTSVFVIQTSDNPIIYTGSISECPLLTYSDDKTESGWPQRSSHSSLFVDGSRIIDKSGISFIGPYILCREDSSTPTETSDTSFSPLFAFDDDGRYISESRKNSFTIKGGYVSTPPKNPTSECSTPVDKRAGENKEARKSELPDNDPPAYTPSPAVGSSAIFSHPSGYCLMPNMENVTAWVSSSVSPLEGNTERRLYQIEGSSPERSYVTLSQRGL